MGETLSRCPYCGQPAPKAMPPLMPGCRLTLAEGLVWKELARTPGYAVASEQLLRHCASHNVLRRHIYWLRRKTGRTINNERDCSYTLVANAAEKVIQVGWPREDPMIWRKKP
jgi:hypothetical protein